MATGLAVDMGTKRISTWTVAADTTAMTTDLLTDTHYRVAGTLTLPQFSGSFGTAVWRSKRLAIDNHPGFTWLYLEGPFASAVVRLYVDGALWYTTPTLTGNEPVRLPSGRYREWEIELESSGRVTGLVMASTADELRAT